MDKLINIIRIIIVVGLSVVSIILINKPENKTILSNNAKIVLPDTTIPNFYNQTPQEGLYSALVYYNLHHPNIVYAQAQLETGHFKSNVCLNYNNLFGLYNSKKQDYYKFNHWVESIIAYKEWIQNKYKYPNNYYQFLDNINYASDSLYISKLKQLVKGNEKRRSIKSSSSNS